MYYYCAVNITAISLFPYPQIVHISHVTNKGPISYTTIKLLNEKEN